MYVSKCSQIKQIHPKQLWRNLNKNKRLLEMEDEIEILPTQSFIISPLYTVKP